MGSYRGRGFHQRLWDFMGKSGGATDFLEKLVVFQRIFFWGSHPDWMVRISHHKSCRSPEVSLRCWIWNRWLVGCDASQLCGLQCTADLMDLWEQGHICISYKYWLNPYLHNIFHIRLHTFKHMYMYIVLKLWHKQHIHISSYNHIFIYPLVI